MRVAWLISGLAFMVAQNLWAIKSSKVDVSYYALYQAVNELTDDLAEDLDSLSEVTRKTTVINYSQTDGLPESLKPYVLKRLELIDQAATQSPVRFLHCAKCQALRAEADGDEIFIKQGLTENHEVKEVMQELGVNNFTEINLAYNDRYLAMQMSVYNPDRSVAWAREYKTPYRGDTSWIMGAEIDTIAFNDPKFPTLRAAKLYFGQRLYALGAAGLSLNIIEETESIAQIATLAGFFSLSHNDVFDQQWDYVKLNYLTEVGVTDFNGKQQLMFGLGAQTKVGLFTFSLTGRGHAFLQDVEDDAEVANDNGEPLIRNDEALPFYIMFGLGLEFV